MGKSKTGENALIIGKIIQMSNTGMERDMEIFDTVEIEGQKYKIVGEGYNPTGVIKDYWNARPIDDKGDVSYTKGGLIIISKKKANGFHTIIKQVKQ